MGVLKYFPLLMLYVPTATRRGTGAVKAELREDTSVCSGTGALASDLGKIGIENDS